MTGLRDRLLVFMKHAARARPRLPVGMLEKFRWNVLRKERGWHFSRHGNQFEDGASPAKATGIDVNIRPA